MKSTSMLESPYLCLRQRVFRLPIRVHQVRQWMELTWSNWLNYLHPSTVLPKKICLIKPTLFRLLSDLQLQQHHRPQQAQIYLKICLAPAKVLQIYTVIIIKNSSNSPLLIYLLQDPKKAVNLIILKMKTQGHLLLSMLLQEELLKITLSIRGDRNLTKSVKSKK